MRFGTFHLLPSPGVVPGELRYAQTMEQVVLADQAGFDVAWFAEHHFSDYGASPNPLLPIVKAAGLTKRITFGQAIIVVTLWHPLRLAEDIAVTDILVDGRFEIGIGRGYQHYEFQGFDTPLDHSREMFEEAVALMLKAWTTEDFTHAGQHWRVPTPITVLPKPLQKPHPPIWVATSSRETLAWTARQGYAPICSGNAHTVESIARLRGFFAEEVAAARANVSIAPTTADRFGVLRYTYVTDTDDEALEEVPRTRWQRRVADHLRRGDQRINRGRNEAYVTPGEPSDEAWLDHIIVGSPERCIEKIRQHAEAGVTELLFWFDFGGLEHRKVLRSMELFATKVLPAVAELEPAGSPDGG